jgi:signal transduction histidine kinase/ligand-binding sensor domain-containing protein
MSARCLILFFLFVFAGGSHGVNRDLPIKQLNHEKWTLKDDGPGEVGAISQTKDGYLWVGSGYSLFRFDGLEFKRFSSSEGLQVPTVSTLFAMDDGGLWVGHRLGGATFIKRNTAIQYSPSQNGFPDGVVYGFDVDHSGTVWVATHEGVARFDGKEWERVDGSLGFPKGSARSLLVDRRGVLWVASNDELYTLKPGSQQFEVLDAKLGWVVDMEQGPDGLIWVADRAGGDIRSFNENGDEGPVVNHLASTLLFDRTGALWVGTQGRGVFRLDGDELSQKSNVEYTNNTMTQEDGLSGDIVSVVFEDTEGNIWIGGNAGLDRFSFTFAVQSLFPVVMNNVALAASNDGSVWAGSSNFPMMRAMPGKVEVRGTPGIITSAFTDASGQIWMAGPSGLWRRNAGILERVAELPVKDPPEAAVRAMAKDSQGRFWLSINRIGLFSLVDGNWKLSPAVSDQPRQIMPVIATTGPDGFAWFGYRDGLLVKRETERLVSWHHEDGVTIGNVTSIAFRDEQVWLGGQYGIAFSEGNRFRQLPVTDEGLLEGIHALIWDRKGNLWAHSSAGVLRIKISDLDAFFNQTLESVPVQWFSGIPKLPNDPYRIHPLPSAIGDHFGRLWFTTTEGVFQIDPGNLEESSAIPKLLITDMLADDQMIDIDAADIEISSGVRRLEIVYAGLLFSAPRSLQFQHRLVGYDNTWTEVGRQGHAIYTGLGPGDYRFEVRTVNRLGGSFSETSFLEFSVQPLFYQTPLFLALCGLGVMAIVWKLYAMRVRFLESNLRARLEERNKERERIARELHDTLLQAFQGLQLQFHAVANQIDKTSSLHSRMERALDRADEALVDARDRVSLLRSRKVMHKDLEQDLINFAQSLEGKDLGKFIIKFKGTKVPLNALIQDELHWIAREAMLNAHKHSSASRIHVLVAYGLNFVLLRIKDNGEGCPEMCDNQNEGHWGIRGMRERAERISAVLELATSKHGTEVSVKVSGGEIYRPDVFKIPPLLRSFVYRRR